MSSVKRLHETTNFDAKIVNLFDFAMWRLQKYGQCTFFFQLTEHLSVEVVTSYDSKRSLKIIKYLVLIKNL